MSWRRRTSPAEREPRPSIARRAGNRLRRSRCRIMMGERISAPSTLLLAPRHLRPLQPEPSMWIPTTSLIAGALLAFTASSATAQCLGAAQPLFQARKLDEARVEVRAQL